MDVILHYDQARPFRVSYFLSVRRNNLFPLYGFFKNFIWMSCFYHLSSLRCFSFRCLFAHWRPQRIPLLSLSIRRFWNGSEKGREVKEGNAWHRCFYWSLPPSHSTQHDSIPSNQNHFRSLGCQLQHRGKTQCAWAKNLISGQLFISGLVYKPIAKA